MSALYTLVETLRHHRRRRLAIRQLQSLPDRLLKDIGVDRGLIPYVVDGLHNPYGTRDSEGTHRPSAQVSTRSESVPTAATLCAAE